MNYFVNFERSGCTFEDRAKATDRDSAVGQLAHGFLDLDRRVSETIAVLLELPPESGPAVTDTLSFRVKADRLVSLIRKGLPSMRHNTGDLDPDNVLTELAQALSKSDELHVQIVAFAGGDAAGVRHGRARLRGLHYV